jgi:hypothetical protein
MLAGTFRPDRELRAIANDHEETLKLNKLGAGIAIGTAVGAGIGATMGNPGAGIAIGIAIGVAIAASGQNEDE